MTDVRATGFLLWMRAALLGGIALLTGVVSHAAADGLLPSAASLLALAGATTLGSAWLLRRPASRLGLVVLAVIGQAATHLVLTVLAGHRGDARVAPPVVVEPDSLDHALMGGYVDPAPQVSLGWTAHLVDHVTSIGPTMALAHLLGAVALAWWLGVGEASLWALLLFVAAEIGSSLLPRLVLVVPDPPALPRAVDVERPGGRRLLNLGTVSRRGPPLPV